ncbi:MAG: hypothetical protein ACJ74Z_06350 [Bryobacteraceae bacterium]
MACRPNRIMAVVPVMLLRLVIPFTMYCLLNTVIMTAKIGNKPVQQIFLKIG